MSDRLARRQLTRDEAISLYHSRRWARWTKVQRARFQLFQSCLCMPFDVFHEALESALGRSVFTHEFAFQDALIDEWFGKIKAPTFAEIIDKFPGKKTIVVVTPDEKESK